MAFIKPLIQKLWASGGAIVQPSDTKIETGWTAEVPPHQWENWIQNRQDQYLAHINERGVPEWDNQTNYIASKSYVQGSDGKLYVSVADSGPLTTVQNPTTDTTDSFWKLLIVDPPTSTETVSGVIQVATQDEANAGVSDTVAITPKKLRWGFSISLGVNSYIVFPSWLGGFVIQAGSLSVASQTHQLVFPLQFPTACTSLVLTGWGGSAGSATHTARNATGALLSSDNVSALECDWIAFGY